MTNPTVVHWIAPTNNVDGSPIQEGEITGFEVGVRLASGSTGVYPFGAKAPATAVTELISSIPNLPTGVDLLVSVRVNTGGIDAAGNPVNSAWSAEVPLKLDVPAPIPNPPTDVSVS